MKQVINRRDAVLVVLAALVLVLFFALGTVQQTRVAHAAPMCEVADADHGEQAQEELYVVGCSGIL